MSTVKTLSKLCRDSRKVAVGIVPALGLGVATWAMPTAAVGASTSPTSSPTNTSPSASPATCGTSLVAEGNIGTVGSIWLHHTSCGNTVFAKVLVKSTFVGSDIVTVVVVRNTVIAAPNTCSSGTATCKTGRVSNSGSTSFGKGTITVFYNGGSFAESGATGKYSS